MTSTNLICNYAELTVDRVPKAKNNKAEQHLMAFDQADVLALDYVHEHGLVTAQTKILVINDTYGALTCGMAKAAANHSGSAPTLWSDSFIAHQALQLNGQANDLPPMNFVQAQDTPQGPFDLVLMRLPKSHTLLADQVARLLPQLAPDAKLIMPVMVKHLDSPVYQLLESLFGAVTTSLAKKKARLVFAGMQQPKSNVSPAPQATRWSAEEWGFDLHHYSGVFSRSRLDPGAQVLLQNFPQGPYNRVIDLGCGNGVQAIMAANKWSNAQVVGVDDSYMAIASATINAQHNKVPDQCEFVANDCLTGMVQGSADLILCNPPFHQERVVGDQIAMRMFKQAANVLDQDGELWVVGNRHLGYHAKLKRWFKRVEQVGAHPKFVVLKAQV